MNRYELEELFAQTLAGNYDSDESWSAVRKLHQLGSRDVFEISAQWCCSKDPLIRARGADVIAQLGKNSERSNSFPEEALAAIAEMVQMETEITPLSSGIHALGHLENSLAAALISQYQAHPSTDVREAVAHALGAYANDTVAIAALTALAADSDSEVRDWATFALGVLGDGDTPEIREALAARLMDSNREAREEAVAGLAKRQDPRALPPLMDMLKQSEISDCVIEAAGLMLGMTVADPKLQPSEYLQHLRKLIR